MRGEEYRYGFNGAEKESEITGNSGDVYDLGLRFYDSRIGRMFSVDPRSPEYPWQTTYAYHRNNPIANVDYLGGGDPKGTTVQEGEGPSQVAARVNETRDKDNQVSTQDIMDWNKEFFKKGSETKDGEWIWHKGDKVNTSDPFAKEDNTNKSDPSPKGKSQIEKEIPWYEMRGDSPQTRKADLYEQWAEAAQDFLALWVGEFPSNLGPSLPSGTEPVGHEIVFESKNNHTEKVTENEVKRKTYENVYKVHYWTGSKGEAGIFDGRGNQLFDSTKFETKTEVYDHDGDTLETITRLRKN